MDERVATNRRRWDEMSDLHVDTYAIDDVDAVGVHTLKSFEADELGDIDGLRVCHLQCHIGGDSFALAQLGAASVVGVDFSPRSVAIAQERAARLGLADRVEFVCATVDDAPSAGGDFDAVYTSWGVLCWLPDLDVWARVVHELLAPGGWLYLAEMHPYATSIRWTDHPYGNAVPLYNDEHGDYTDIDAQFEYPESWEWTHGLGDVVSALARAGMRMDWLHEHAESGWHLNDPEHLTQQPDGMWEVAGSTLPLSFSLRASRV